MKFQIHLTSDTKSCKDMGKRKQTMSMVENEVLKRKINTEIERPKMYLCQKQHFGNCAVLLT